MSQRPNPEGQFFCEGCQARYDLVGDCASCSDEPLLDLLDEDVLLMLQSFDEVRRQQRLTTLSSICAVFCAPLLLVLLVPIVGKHLLEPIYGQAMRSMSEALLRVYPAKRNTPDMGQRF